ncbi:MAG: hypothetical protein G01um101456_442 [Parcubacteria group bacterium Gr01-1014_56]|nr:MAG: hypothetical protein G01um101456_442 [Parcubacteria group bacterium Gr01-1014_56]
MNQYFTNTFFKFFFGFLVIIAAAFGILIGASAVLPPPVDSVAAPQ